MTDSQLVELTVPLELAGMRCDQALARLLPDYSRGQITRWIKLGTVRIDGAVPKPKSLVRVGQSIQLAHQTDAEATIWQPQAIALDIVFEDAAVLIVNKPAGLVVHPGAGQADGTLVNALLHHCPSLAQVPRAGIVHRLDKETTGLLMIAKTLKAHHALVQQLQARSVHRLYHAVVHGVLISGGSIDAPIARHHQDRKKMAIVASGKPAITHYRIHTRFRAQTHITCQLETGRTHQIRVHLASIRHPLVGDPVYGQKNPPSKGLHTEALLAIKQFPRQALHAAELGFIHPTTHQEMQWSAPLPRDMQDLLAALSADLKAEENP